MEGKGWEWEPQGIPRMALAGVEEGLGGVCSLSVTGAPRAFILCLAMGPACLIGSQIITWRPGTLDGDK